MLKLNIFNAALIATAVISTNALAVQFGKPMTTSVVVTDGHTAGSKKTVTVMNILLTPHEKTMLMNAQPKNQTSTKMATAAGFHLPSSVNLKMNDVPVLDQGQHGACVTFAVTAAMNALIGKGDYVSQLCNLTLGNYLENNGYMPSGWNGSFGPLVIDQMSRFGVINKQKQREHGCGGLKEYPGTKMAEEGKPMNVREFKNLSEDISGKFYSIQHMTMMERLETQFADTDATEKMLTQIKTGLMHGHRFVIGVFLKMSLFCSAAACANHNQAQDTWALTKELEAPVVFIGGHEMVVTGYDDTAVAYDKEGKKHQGLLTLRNSWGTEVGDHGDYYMSYDYFKQFVMEVNEIVEAS
jgi:hypothetical protein